MKRKYLFYYEEAVDAWVSVPEKTESFISEENIEVGDFQEIRFTVFEMTEEEYKNLPVD